MSSLFGNRYICPKYVDICNITYPKFQRVLLINIKNSLAIIYHIKSSLTIAARNKFLSEKQKCDINESISSKITITIGNMSMTKDMESLLLLLTTSDIFSAHLIDSSFKYFKSIDAMSSLASKLSITNSGISYWNPFSKYNSNITIKNVLEFLPLYMKVNIFLHVIKYIDKTFELLGHIPSIPLGKSKEYTSFTFPKLDHKINYQNWNSNFIPRNTYECTLLITRTRLCKSLKILMPVITSYEILLLKNSNDKQIVNGFIKNIIPIRQLIEVQEKIYPYIFYGVDKPLIKIKKKRIKRRDIKIDLRKSLDKVKSKINSHLYDTIDLFTMDFMDHLKHIFKPGSIPFNWKSHQMAIYEHFRGMRFICSMKWLDSLIVSTCCHRIVIGYRIINKLQEIITEVGYEYIDILNINYREIIQYVWTMMHDLIPLIHSIECNKWASDDKIFSIDKGFKFQKLYPYTERSLTVNKILDPRPIMFSAFKKRSSDDSDINPFKIFLIKSLPILFEVRRYADFLEKFEKMNGFNNIQSFLLDIVTVFVTGMYLHIPKIGKYWRCFSTFIKFTSDREKITSDIYSFFKSKYKILRAIIQEFLCYIISQSKYWLFVTNYFLKSEKDNFPHSKGEDIGCFIKNTMNGLYSENSKVRRFILSMVLQSKIVPAKPPLDVNGVNILWDLWFFDNITHRVVNNNLKTLSNLSEELTSKLVNMSDGHRMGNTVFIYNNIKKPSNLIRLRIYKLKFVDFVLSKIEAIQIKNKVKLDSIVKELEHAMPTINDHMKKFERSNDLLTGNSIHHGAIFKTMGDFIKSFDWMVKEFSITERIVEIMKYIYELYVNKASSRYIQNYIEEKCINNFENFKAIMFVKIILIIKKKSTSIKAVEINNISMNEKLTLAISIQRRYKYYVNSFIQGGDNIVAEYNKKNFRKLTSLLVANCCKRVASLTGYSNFGAKKIFSTLHMDVISDMMSRGEDPFQKKYLKCCKEFKSSSKKYSIAYDKELSLSKVNIKRNNKALDKSVKKCGNLFDNKIISISLTKYILSTNDNGRYGHIIYSLCISCGCIFKRKLYNFEINSKHCNRCIETTQNNMKVSFCMFSNRIKYISPKECVMYLQHSTRGGKVCPPLQFCINQAQNLFNFSVSQWKKSGGAIDRFFTLEETQRIIMAPVKIITVFDGKKMQFSKFQVSSEIFKSKIIRRMSKVGYIHGNIIRQFNNCDIQTEYNYNQQLL